jgi:hypothetical protein
MNLDAFLTTYRAAIERLPSWLVDHPAPEVREARAYSLDQLLMQRDRAIAAAAPDFLRRLLELDHQLLELAPAVRDALGVHVGFFLGQVPQAPAA